jgi:ribonuclease HI
MHRVKFHWVKGPAGNTNNELVDRLAVQAYQTGVLEVDEAYEALNGA